MLVLGIMPGAIVGTSAAMLAPQSGSAALNTIILILAALAGLGTVIGIVFGMKWKIAHAVEVKAREGERALADALDERVRLVVHERDECSAKLDRATAALTEASKTIARLEALPNLERVLELVASTFNRIDQRMQERHEAALDYNNRRFDELATRLDRIDRAA